jgi:fumarate hydratase class I
MKQVTIPISDESILDLEMGDPVMLSGVILTGRDAVHKWMVETFIEKTRQPQNDDLEVYEAIRPLLDGGIIYHCGPVVSGLDTGNYRFVAARVMEHFNLKGVIGKGGMGPKTLAACQEGPGVYFSAIGGAAALIAKSVQEVTAVYKLDFGVPEAIWVLDVKDFPVVVTMDAHGKSLHAEVEQHSNAILTELLSVV